MSGKISATEGAAQKKIRARTKYVGPGIESHTPADPSPAVVWLEGAPEAKVEATTIELRQEGIELRPRVAAVTKGSSVKFPNQDAVYHNVFSYSKAKRFDLGRYPQGESKTETFEEKGLVEMRCEVHEHMRAYLHVFDHPWFAVATADGSYSIPKVPPGKYTLVVWKEFFDPVRREIEVKADGAKADVSLALSDGTSEPGSVLSCCAR